MAQRVKINEEFLINSKVVPLNPDLPFRLQKRQLFAKLGFPTDQQIIPVPIKNKERIKKTLEAYFKKYTEFIIITSPKPMLNCIPPLFKVHSRETITYRDTLGHIEQIKYQQISAKLKELPPQSWVEFARNLWGGETIAGRLVYVSAEEQILEIQKRVEILEMDEDPTHSFDVTLSFFEFPNSYSDWRLLTRSSLKKYEVEGVINALKRCFSGFEVLKRIANLPALEFAYTQEEGLLVIDADWPIQYQY